MDSGTALFMFFQQIWRLFTIESPFFGLKVYEILFGLLICEFGIGLLGEIFVGLFNTSAPSKQEDFKERYNNWVWRGRYIRYHRAHNE